MAAWCGRNAKTQSPGQDTCPVWTHMLFKSDQGQESLEGSRLWGRTELDTTEAT